MERTVLHVDCNKFYASVECLHRPELRDKPVAVGGSTESRHGIILTKNEIASRYGLVAGEPLWQARQKCPQLVVVPPNFPLYMRFSKMARRIYEDYSDYIEPFGLDENWLDVTGDDRTGEQIAQEIRRRVKAELGITVSVGVSFNKIFAKLGSDFKEAGIDVQFVQDNQSASKKGVLRGLHFQINYPQDKLVRVVNGEVFDVAVDLREGSKTYGKWFGVLLSAENKKQFFIPKNFAHGFIVLSDYAEFAYKCTDFYHPNDEGGLYFDDPEIGVEWPMPEGMTKEDLIISEKDHKWGGIKDLKK